MSTDKIALTSSMRSNLLSLKNTQELFDSTQNKLSTGYKVNSAMDNPSSYFTAQSLNSRADDLNTLLDNIGQAVSTLEVADQGITSLQDLVSQAKSVANSARDASNVQASTTSNVYFDTDALKSKTVVSQSTAAANDKMVIRYGDSTSMTGTTNVQEDTKLSEIATEGALGSVRIDGTEYKIATNGTANNMTTASTYAATDVFKIKAIDTTAGTYTLEDADGNAVTVTGTIAATTGDSHAAAVGDTVSGITAINTVVSEDGKTSYTVTGTAALTEDADHKYVAGTVNASSSATTTTINVKAGSTVAEMSDVMENMIGTNKVSISVEDSKLNISTKDTTSVEVTGAFATAFGMDAGVEITLDATDTAESLRQKIDALDGVSAEINDKGAMVIKSEYGDDLVISGALAEKLGVSGQATNGSNETAEYASQYNDILTQIDELVQDTSYKGVNLLNGNDLKVVFNENSTSTMELKGVTFDSTGLGFTAAEGDWKTTASIDKSFEQISKATSTLRTQASKFGQQLSTIEIRQDFTENMVNELQSGADKLTLADNNEEAANLLALQTRQSLATNSLSLANQSAQSVLQLF